MEEFGNRVEEGTNVVFDFNSKTNQISNINSRLEMATQDMVLYGNMDTDEIDIPMQLENGPVEIIPPSQDHVFYPQVGNDIKPFKGQEFRTWEEAQIFYTKYASAAGFIVRIGSSRRSRKTNEFIRKEFFCNKQGFGQRELTGDEKRIRGVVREDCKARMVVVMTKTCGFIVNFFDESHNHPLTSPEMRHLVKSNRGSTKAQRLLREQLSMVNIPTYKQFDILGVQAGGFQHIGCTQQDLYNLQRDRRKKTKGHDGEMLHDYFLLEQEKDSGFYFTIKVDEESKITHCFWADSLSRQSYKFYGDVIIFDTTYQTNRYGLIFAPLLGINNHGQTIVFGAAFLSDETSNSFVWLLKEFLRAMLKGPPKMIITDQDPAMEKAISEVLPDTFHRYCSWHILRKFSEKLDAIKYRDYYDDFRKCIYSSENGEEFELKWSSVLARSGLDGHSWLQSIYQIRFRWVSAFMNHIFSAGMSSSQRAESAHSFFKDYVSNQNSLVDFMVQFTRGLLHKRHEELICDHIDINEKPRYKCPSKMEKQMADVFTRKYYYIVQEQLWESYNYNLVVASDDELSCKFMVVRENHEDGRSRVIIYDKTKDFISCSCKLFESTGIPCRHMFAFLQKISQVHKLPSQYILKRWTKSAKSEVVTENSGLVVTSRKTLLEKRGLLFQKYSSVIDSVVLSEEATKLFDETMELLIEKIKPLLNSDEGVESCATRSPTHQPTIREPDEVKTKGRAKRIKRGKEKTKAKRNGVGRHCHGCGKYGQTHDKRNCPVLLNLNESGSNFCEEDIDDDSSSQDD